MKGVLLRYGRLDIKDRDANRKLAA
jgi:hypothetical protein